MDEHVLCRAVYTADGNLVSGFDLDADRLCHRCVGEGEGSPRVDQRSSSVGHGAAVAQRHFHLRTWDRQQPLEAPRGDWFLQPQLG